MTYKKHVAIVQEPASILDLNLGVARAVEYIRQAAKEGAQLVVFPETWLTGYPAWIFGMAGWNDSEARRWYSRLLEECPTSDDSALDPIRKAARDTGTTVSLGFNERPRSTSGSIFNSILLIGSSGETLNLHRKLTPTHTERIVWAQGDASGLNVVDSPIGRIGSLVCWEHWHPLIRYALHSQDEQIHVASWPDMTDSHGVASQSYAFEGRCYVISSAQYLTIDGVPEAILEAYKMGVGRVEGADSVLFRGGSGIAHPDGSWLAPQVFDQAGLVHAEIDLATTMQYKHDLDVVGHYAREDIFQLSVDRSARSCVIWEGLPVRP